jgi:methylase of polypeptide subunit release factors
LARIHHEAFGDLARDAGPAIVRHLRRADLRSGLVVDLGCGSGILARHLMRSGYRVGVHAKGEVVRQLRARGFAVRTLRDYGSPLPPRRVVFLARLMGHRV